MTINGQMVISDLFSVSESFTGPTLLVSYTAIIDSNVQVLQYTHSQLQRRSKSLAKGSVTMQDPFQPLFTQLGNLTKR